MTFPNSWLPLGISGSVDSEASKRVNTEIRAIIQVESLLLQAVNSSRNANKRGSTLSRLRGLVREQWRKGQQGKQQFEG